MNLKKKNLLIILTISVILSGLGYVTFFRNWSQPLSPALDLQRPESTSQTVFNDASETQPLPDNPESDLAPISDDSSDAQEPETEVLDVKEKAPICGGPREILILAVGVDSDDEAYLYGLADVIRLVYVDFLTPKVVVFALPRDLWVEVPGISDNYNITHGKLNQAYLYGNPGLGYYDGPGAGPGLLARTIAHNYGIFVDHYGALSMRTFVDIVDSLGGVDIYLEESVDGNADGGLDDYFEDFGYFPAGWNHLDGEKALSFSRIRSVDSTLGRQDRQSQVLLALRENALSLKGVSHIPNMIRAFIGRTQTDLSKAQLSQLTCLGTRLKVENIHFEALPDSYLKETSIYSEQLKGNTFIFEVDSDKVGEYILSTFISR